MRKRTRLFVFTSAIALSTATCLLAWTFDNVTCTVTLGIQDCIDLTTVAFLNALCDPPSSSVHIECLEAGAIVEYVDGMVCCNNG
jgi:hypothetical protein